jgi:CubicO group peptidase (beta-lactamase class C family)
MLAKSRSADMKALIHYLALLPLACGAASAEETTALRIAWDRRDSIPLLAWSNVVGQTYLLGKCENFDQPFWTPLIYLTGDGRSTVWTDEAQSCSSRFYRIGVMSGSNWTTKLQSALDRVRASSGARGLAAAVITSSGMWQGTSGFSVPSSDVSIQPQMRFSIASMTKTFTAALIMQLAEEGKLNLDDPISRWVDNYPNITNTITIRQLLTHTSGIYDFTDNPGYLTLITKTPEKQVTLSEVLALVGAPRFPPGRNWEYSSTGFTLLGMVAEAITRQPVHLEFRRRFLEPLQLRGTYLKPPNRRPGTGSWVLRYPL